MPDPRRPTPRRGHWPRTLHRHPIYGGQARRGASNQPYIVGLIVVVAVLAAFLYVGLNWATGPGRLAALATPPTPTAVPVLPPTPPPPTPTVGEQTYIVKAGDSPASIAAEFHVKTEDLLTANSIQDPQRLQIGQTLKIPAPTSTPRG